MITKLFSALGVRTINSQTFANGYYYEYSMDVTDGVIRRLRNRYNATDGEGEQPVKVETPDRVEVCKQALMYNFPHAFNIDGSVAIELPELPGPTTPDAAAAGTESASQTN